jgi:uncharacterized protein
MDRNEILKMLSSHRLDMERLFGVTSLSLFGSVIRLQSGPCGDVDIMADFPGAPSFDQYMGLKLYLEDLLHVRIDLVTRRGLREQLRPAIEREAVRVS